MRMDYEYTVVEMDYEKICRRIREEYENQVQDISSTLIAELNEKKKTILNEIQLMDLRTF